MNPFEALEAYVEAAKDEARRRTNPFESQAVMATRINATFRPERVRGGVIMHMWAIGAHLTCHYGRGGTQTMDEFLIQLDALALAGHPQAEVLQRWAAEQAESGWDR